MRLFKSKHHTLNNLYQINIKGTKVDANQQLFISQDYSRTSSFRILTRRGNLPGNYSLPTARPEKGFIIISFSAE